jgi:hypothetical protein
MLPRVRLQRLPRMADFAPWATASESAFRPRGTACSNNQRAVIENIADVDPVAAHVREIMADKAQMDRKRIRRHYLMLPTCMHRRCL